MQTPQTFWQRWIDKVSQVVLLLLTSNVTFGLIAGSIVAIFFDETVPWDTGQPLDIMYGLAVWGYVMTLALSLPALVFGIWASLRGRLEQSGGLLVFVAAFGTAAAFEGLSHLLFIHCNVTPFICRYDYDYGLIIYDRWHLLHHTLVALPMLILFWFILKRWYPTATKFGKIIGA